MLDPRIMSPGSIMPNYPWLLDDKIDTASTPAKIRAMQKMGVPYPQGFDLLANKDLMEQAGKIRDNLKADKIQSAKDAEIIALIAYMQRLGVDIKAGPKEQTASK